MLAFNRKLRQLVFCCPNFLALSRTQKANYVDVKMKWKKDSFYDSFDMLNKARDLRALISLKNIVAQEPDACIPISLVSKRNRILEISGRVASFLRRYPSVFEEYTGPKYNLPWFRLTKEAFELHQWERKVFDARRPEIVDRLRRLILMSTEHRLPLRVVQGMLWHLGLPEDYLQNSEEISNGYFQIVEMGDGEEGLSASINQNELLLSVLQRNAMKKLDMPMDVPPSVVAFPLFPSKGLRLKHKIETWLEGFQSLPYVSPYEDSSGLDPNSDVAEKRVAGVLHELLSLFVDNSAERRRLLCLKKHLRLPQKFYKAFERHPHVFYLLLKSKTCFVVLKEAYCAGSATAIERHPILDVRVKYVKLMNKSEALLKSRRSKRQLEEVPKDCSDVVIDSHNREDADEYSEGMEESLR